MTYRRKQRETAVPSDRGPLCAECGDTIFTIGDEGQPGTIVRRTRTGRKLRRDSAYCGDECRRIANESFQALFR